MDFLKQMDTLNFELKEQIELIKKFEQYIEKEEVNIFWYDINSCSLCYDRICVRVVHLILGKHVSIINILRKRLIY